MTVSFLLSLLILFANVKLLSWVDAEETRDLYVMIAGLVLTAAMLAFTALKAYPRDIVDGVLLVDPAHMISDCYAAAGCASGFFLVGF